MKNTVFTGAGTAIITPFTQDGVDWETFGRLIDYQLAEGIDAIVAAGTTGEGTTLTAAEHEEVISFTVRRVKGKVPVIAGAGSNDTAKAIEATKTACAAGAARPERTRRGPPRPGGGGPPRRVYRCFLQWHSKIFFPHGGGGSPSGADLGKPNKNPPGGGAPPAKIFPLFPSKGPTPRGPRTERAPPT